jgi:sulfur-oxidizing protein SoxY
MTAQDYVKTIHLIAEKNPRPLVAAFHLGPRAGRAEIDTRIRLNGTQRVVAVATMSDGSQWRGMAEVDVTESACYDATNP